MKKTTFVLLILVCLSQVLSAAAVQKTITDSESGLQFNENATADFSVKSINTGFKSRDNRMGILWQTSAPAAIMGQVCVSDVTGNSFAEWHLNDECASLYHDTANPLWVYPVGNLDFGFPVDMTEDGSVLAIGNGSILSVFDPSSAVPTWELTANGMITKMVLNQDGSIVFMGIYDQPHASSEIKAYNINNSTPIWSNSYGGSVGNLVISGDGSTLVFTQYGGGNSAMRVLDSADGSLIFEAPEYNQNPPAISYDASIIVNGDYSGYAQVYEFDEDTGTYEEKWNFNANAGTSTWIGGMSVSADGSTIAIGTLVFLGGGYDGELFVFDTSSPIPLWTYGNAGDYIISIDMSTDGSVIAAAGYGPMDHSTPDFFLFRKQSNIPLFEINTPGSMNSVDMAADGSFCSVGGKAVHARVMGSGGLLYSVDCNLGGGTLTGTVNLENTDDNSDVKVEVAGIEDYFDYTDSTGYFIINNIPENLYTIEFRKVGYEDVDMFPVVINEGGITDVGEVEMTSLGAGPTNLIATQAAGLTVDLFWDEVQGNPTGYNIYRKITESAPFPEEPYATISATQTNFEDTDALPMIDYYYVVTAIYDGGVQSPYSNLVIGWISTGFVVDEISVYEGITPVIDGVISPQEWDDAYRIDCSDFWGTHDNTINPIGSVIGYFKMNADETELYVAYINYNDSLLEDHDEVALYIDDNDDGVYPPAGDDSEGNYWAAYYSSGSVIKYRPIYETGGVGTVIYLDNPQIAVSADEGYLVYEFVIPFGDETWELTPSAENKSSLAIFVLDDNTPDPNGFDGWWPFDNINLFNPADYGTISYGVEVQTPPAPENVNLVENVDETLTISWDMPNINDLDFFNIYRSIDQGNFELYDITVGISFIYSDLVPNTEYQFYITTVNQSGLESDPSEIVEYVMIGIENNEQYVTELFSNFPNPFNPDQNATNISFSLKYNSKVDISIYNIKGQMVRSLTAREYTSGVYNLIWNGINESGQTVKNGIYFYKMKLDEKNFDFGKMLLLR
ncbi:MAG: fibronectin type III domain-containing protein [Candidatus Cloacimonadota bacterium]|nr:fibronectin type III domain-containing protein [Candidatus Cloacimonadota bacterium]